MSEQPENFAEQLNSDPDLPGGVDSGDAEGDGIVEQYKNNTDEAEQKVFGADEAD